MKNVAKRVTSHANACVSRSMNEFVITSKYGSPPL